MLKNPNFPTEGAYSAYTAPRPSKLVARRLDICPKYARILHYVCQNFRDFGGGPLARGWAPGPPPAKSGPVQRAAVCWHGGVGGGRGGTGDSGKTRRLDKFDGRQCDYLELARLLQRSGPTKHERRSLIIA